MVEKRAEPPDEPRRRFQSPSRLDPVRTSALCLLVDFDASPFPIAGRVERDERRLSSDRERGLYRGLVLETLRHRSRVDWLVEGYLQHGSMASLTAWIRNILRLGTTQILLLPAIPPHAILDTSVTLARRYGHRGTAGLVNAVLHRILQTGRRRWASLDQPPEDAGGAAPPSPEGRGPDKAQRPDKARRSDEARHSEQVRRSDEGRRSGQAGGPDEPEPSGGAGAEADWLALRYSHPSWLVRRWLERWGRQRTERLLEWDNRPPDYWVRLAPGAVPPAGAEPGWIPGTARFDAGSRPAQRDEFARGRFTIQDGSAVLVGLLPPRVEGLVLDVCAAPGGKLGHLAERSDGSARLVALDRSPGRLRRLRTGLRRLGREAHLVAADSRQLPIRAGWDGVVIDAPCSNLGVIRRRVDLKWRATEEEIARLAAIQEALIREAAGGVAPGGWLLYSVCTLEREETTRQRAAFFDRHPEWRSLPLSGPVPDPARGEAGEMVLIPGEEGTDGGYAFLAQRGS